MIAAAAYAARRVELLRSSGLPAVYAHGDMLPPLRGSTRTPGVRPETIFPSK